jgi:hypothetical protein
MTQTPKLTLTDRISVSVKDAAWLLGVSQSRMRELINKGAVQVGYEGSKPLVSVPSLQAYYDGLPTERSA